MTGVDGNYLVPTANRPFLPIAGLPGVGLKSMHLLDKPSIWSAIIAVNMGSNLPVRRHDGLCEILVVRGNGHYASGQQFGEGDYLRETEGNYETILSDDRLELFVTHHGYCVFLDRDGDDAFFIGPETVRRQFPAAQGLIWELMLMTSIVHLGSAF